MEMLSSYGGAKHEFCLVVVELPQTPEDDPQKR